MTPLLFPALRLALLLTIAPADSTSARKPVAPRTIAELEGRIRHVLDSAKVPGMGLAIVRHDSIVYTGGFGKARLVPPVPATDSTLFRIGSTSKAFAALTAMALVHEGKLSLDDKLSDRLPGFYYRNPWEATDPIRVHHLLEHTAGFDDNSLMSYATNDTSLTLAQGLQLDSATHVSRWRPGTLVSYCNSGPAIVALMIERIEGKPFEQVVQERWFDRIGMRTATYFRPDSTRFPVATLYDGDPPAVQPYWHVFIRPAGSINASAHDMAAYVRFLLGRGTLDGMELLPRASLERMEHSRTSNAARAGLVPGYGLHLWRAADSTGFVWTQHNGGVSGGLSDMSYLPEHGVGYAFQINNGDGEAMRLLTQAVRAFVTLGLAPAEPELPAAPIAATTRAAFAGWYRPLNSRIRRFAGVEAIMNVVRVSFTDSAMAVTPLLGAARTFVAVDSVRFRRPGEREATLAFVHDDANDRANGIEDVAGGLATSYGQESAVRGLGSIVVAVVGLGGLALALVAMVWGGVRCLLKRARHRALAPSAMRRAWRGLALLALLAVAWVTLVSEAASDLQVIGTFNAITAIVWALGYVFALGTLLVLLLGWRSERATGTWAAASRWSARTIMLCVTACAGYLLATGVIGWRTWMA